jgi:hypothetical protein
VLDFVLILWLANPLNLDTKSMVRLVVGYALEWTIYISSMYTSFKHDRAICSFVRTDGDLVTLVPQK